MDIQWKTIKGFEDYQINNIGEVRRIKARVGTSKKVPYLLSKRINNSGYVHYNLSNGITTKNFLAHRLVAQYFIKNDNALRNQINHKDGNKQNNNIDNLEWVTQSENRQHFHKYLKWNWKNNPLKSKMTKQYSLDGKLIAQYPSQAEVQRKLGFNQSKISLCCLGKRKSAYGYIWKN